MSYLDKSQEQDSASAPGGLNRLSGESPRLLISTEVKGGLGLCITGKDADLGLVVRLVTGQGPFKSLV